MEIFDIIVVVFLGLGFGSFATALSYRLPRDISIVTKQRSQCPACQKNLGVFDLIPVFSWLFLKGKCRQCKAAIGWRYPVIEVATVLLCLLFYAVYGLRFETVLVFILAPVIVSIMDIDLHYKIIPDSLNLSILLTGVALLIVNAFLNGNPILFLEEKGMIAVGGVILYGFGSLALRQGAMMILKREPMGLGDIKFFAAAGFFLGVDPNAAALFLVISGLSGVVLAMTWKKITGDVEFPFGPSLIVGFVATICFFIPTFINL